MAQAYIVDAVRTPGGKRNGEFAGWHPVDMAAEILNGLVDRTGIDPGAVEDVIMGCVTQAGEQAIAFGRNAVLASKLPQSVPGMAIADIDLFEVNEAFAPIPLAWPAATGADPDRLNVNGGAIALGRPLGASGTKLMATLINALRAGASAMACRPCAKAAEWPM